jgi:hypothetical protein
MIETSRPTASRTTRNISSFSSAEVVGDSPVVPETSKSEPASARRCASAPRRSKSTFRSSSNGVTIAVINIPGCGIVKLTS